MEKAAIIIGVMISSLLGGITPRQFLRDYWQEKPLLIRQALPGFNGLLSRDELLKLACSEDVESRLIHCADWTLKHGPMSPRDFRSRKGQKNAPWTLLVQGINLAVDAGDQLLRKFDFIPHARLDDLMASYATDGGGVGPHFDNYDVFLLQGAGQRRWRIGAQKDKTLVDGLPLKILKNFKPTQEFLLNPGDMLYLPPQYAHDGVAVGECTTWSIGFRAPPYAELGEGFLTYLQEQLKLDGRYADADLQIQRHAAEISDAMIDRVAAEIAKIRWDRRAIGDFLGSYLTEPKPTVFFDPPQQPLPPSRFSAAAIKRGIRLDRRSQLLFSRNRFYINGELEDIPTVARPMVKALADQRQLENLDRVAMDTETVTLLHQWYCDGFLHLR
jgi:50S ribosomal protein L16 3-hydroxylase